MRNRRRDRLQTSPEERALREAYDRALMKLQQEEIRTSYWAKSDALQLHLAPLRAELVEARRKLDAHRKQKQTGKAGNT